MFARQLLLKRHGYPLWVPEPHGYSVAYRTKGIRIGDVGYVTQDGGFETLFNIRASADDPINQRGVPDNFEPIDVGEYDIIHTPQYHEPGVVIPSVSARKVPFGADTQHQCVTNTLHLSPLHSQYLQGLSPLE
jgi:hypothetical protein